MSRSIPQSPRELAPEGTHNAVAVQFLDLGTQTIKTAGGDKQSRRCQIGFQLVDEETEAGKAMMAYKKYAYSDYPTSFLMVDLKAWLGVKDGNYDMENILGKPAIVTIEHSEDGKYANIISVAGLPKGSKVKKHTEPLVSLFLDDTFDQDAFDSLHDKLKENIAKSKEYIACTAKLKKGKTKPADKAPAKGTKGKKK